MAAPSNSAFPHDVEIDGKVYGVRLAPGQDWIGKAYFRLKQESLLPVFFHENPTVSLSEFLAWAMNATVLGCFANPDDPTLDTTELMGAVFVRNSKKIGEDLTIEVGEFFFRGVQHRYTELFGKMGVSFCFRVLKVAAIFGVTPVNNRVGCRYPKCLGFEQLGPIPNFVGWGGKSVPAILSFLTRERWISLQEGM
jgi:hypothetical protein